MTLYVMLTVDLNRGVSEDARNRFNEHLSRNLWIKMKLTTTWYVPFTTGSTPEGALRTTKSHLKQAAAYAGISNYEGAAVTSDQPPTVWNQASV